MPTFSEILQTKLIPWSQQNVHERFIVGRSKMRQADMPSGVQLNRRNIISPRIVNKNRRCYNNTRNIAAVWPEAGLHEVNKFTMACVLNGHVDFQLGNYRLRSGAGSFIVIPPGTPHPDGSLPYVDTDKSTFFDILYFLLHPNALECWISHGGMEGRERSGNRLILHERVVYLFHALMDELQEDDEGASLVVEGLLLAFLNLLKREADAGRFQSTRLNNPVDALDAEAMNSPHANFATRLEHYVHTNYRKPLTLEHVARDMYLSTAQFTRKVRREMNKSFNQYLLEYRLVVAKDLLLHSEWTVSAVADLVGFQSVNYFCTFFKERLGETPSEFRNRHEKMS